VHSCLLLSTAREALDFPRAVLELSVCLGCGFIWNLRFDPGQMAYARDYEDQQCFSPTFNRFAQSLGERLIERYHLHQKDVIEIGCGKGDFLRLLCELGNNRGVGIDPSVDPDRNQHAPGGRIVWVAEYFGPQHARFPADLVCCRHTLEHVPAVGKFLQTLQQVLGSRAVPVFFEVPDMMRVLETCAFEDIYYEHCSYFTLGSLARLFRRGGFALEALYRDYGDQYVLLEARRVNGRAQPAGPDEESVADILLAVEAFRGRIDARKQFWQDVFGRSRDQRLAIWGSGSKCVALLSNVQFHSRGLCVVDNNPHRHGKFLAGSGLQVNPPEFLRHYQPERIIAMNGIYLEEIAATLKQLGVAAELIAL